MIESEPEIKIHLTKESLATKANIARFQLALNKDAKMHSKLLGKQFTHANKGIFAPTASSSQKKKITQHKSITNLRLSGKNSDTKNSPKLQGSGKMPISHSIGTFDQGKSIKSKKGSLKNPPDLDQLLSGIPSAKSIATQKNSFTQVMLNNKNLPGSRNSISKHKSNSSSKQKSEGKIKASIQQKLQGTRTNLIPPSSKTIKLHMSAKDIKKPSVIEQQMQKRNISPVKGQN